MNSQYRILEDIIRVDFESIDNSTADVVLRVVLPDEYEGTIKRLIFVEQSSGYVIFTANDTNFFSLVDAVRSFPDVSTYLWLAE